MDLRSSECEPALEWRGPGISTEHGDPGCVSALAEVVGHAPPFSVAELAAVESLTVVHARDLTPLARCTGLRALRVVAAELDSPTAPDLLSALAKLEHVELIASRLESTDFLPDCGNLDRKDLLFTAFPDPARAADEVLSAAGSGTIIGVPFDVDIGEYLTGIGELRSEYERTQCMRLFQLTGAVFGLIGGRYGLLVRPGLPVLTDNAFDAVCLSTAELEEALDDPDSSLETLFGRFEVFVPDPLELLAQPTAQPVETIGRLPVDVQFTSSTSSPSTGSGTRTPMCGCISTPTMSSIARTPKLCPRAIPCGRSLRDGSSSGNTRQ